MGERVQCSEGLWIAKFPQNLSSANPDLIHGVPEAAYEGCNSLVITDPAESGDCSGTHLRLWISECLDQEW